jgi:hypothetical protein
MGATRLRMRSRSTRLGHIAERPGDPELSEGGVARRALLLALMAGVLLGVLACGTELTVSPPVAVSRVPTTVLTGRLLYSGEPQYVPRVLRNREDSPALFVYSAQSFTERKSLPVLGGGLNPLSIFGFPTGTSTVTANARLEIRLGSRSLATYGATARAQRARTLYGSDGLEELTRRALFAVRDNLEAQLINDLQGLSQALPH